MEPNEAWKYVVVIGGGLLIGFSQWFWLA